MAATSYKDQAELFFKDYIIADSQILYTSVICGICASKTVYDLSQLFSPVYFKSYSKLTKDHKIEWNNRVISTFHAIFITTMSLYMTFWSDLYCNSRFSTPISRRCSLLSTFVLGASTGYFLSDIGMIFWFYPSLGGLEYVVHHLLSIVSLFYVIITGEGQIYAYMTLISETTTPYVNLRWYLDVVAMKKSRMYLINGVALFVTWLVARIIWFIYLFYHVATHYDEVKQMQVFGQYLIVFVSLVLVVMNLIWFSKIIKGMKKTILAQSD